MGDEGLFKSYEQGRGALFPTHLAQELDPSDPAFFIDEVVEALDLRSIEFAAAGTATIVIAKPTFRRTDRR
jgi:hypothetical protein